eukprot:TRINITY_DN59152_c0_g1_i1.p1 TRINITY_DN59152_c0_g1~~TRINITY_DN59152_c0_g1_i1.p1  ORF type:complete len:520 (+),score=98.89 TRINITY_DN59152_c0_g1_i1:47-1606(+)
MDAAMVAKADTGLEVPESMVYFVFMTMFIDVIAACISTPVMPYYAQEFGVSTAWIGYIYAAWSITSALFAPVLSGMADKWGRKKVLVTCLTGAGLANVIQGLAVYLGHDGFWIFLFGRAFSGCFASIGATCNVYISDVCTNDATRNQFLGQMSMVPLVAIMVGPGLGGGLAAAFGNNVPVLIDGLITLFSACVVQSFLEETPAFLRSRLNADVEKGAAGPNSSNEKKALPRAIYVVGMASFAASLAGQMNLSMYSLFFQKIYDFSALYIGFVFMGNAVVMLLTNMIILPQLRKCLKSAQMYFGGALVSGTGVICLGLSALVDNVHLSLGCVYFGGVGGATSTSQASSIVASFTDVSNRGRIFGLNQTFQNIGKIIGPMVATNVAVHGLFGHQGFFGLPFLISGSCTMCAGCVMLASLAFVEAPKVETETPSKLQRRATAFGEHWENEQGSEEDVKALGKYVAQLLTDRHYKWVTRRADIEKLLDDVLPELKVDSRCAYEESFKQLQTMRMQVACMAQQA